MAKVSLRGLAEAWEEQQSIRKKVRDTGSAFCGTSEKIPPVHVKEAIHNKAVILPALKLMGSHAPKPGKLFQISEAEAQ